jgi:SAM-dependent methyltransferase
LPDLAGQVVLDLGCGIGDQAAALASCGATVLGFDANEALLATAEARNLDRAQFRLADLGRPLPVAVPVDGIWCSFTAACFPDLVPRLNAWKTHLKSGGWIALLEVDHLFGHEPISADTKALLDSYTHESLTIGRYDFHMGHKLSAHLEAAGFTVQQSILVPDRELCFDGPAEPEVLAAWSARLSRLAALERFCGPRFASLRDDFLAALASAEHRTSCTVHCCIARRAPAVRTRATSAPPSTLPSP